MRLIKVLWTEWERQLDDKRFDALLHQLPSNTHAEIGKYYRWQDRQSRLFGKLLLQKGLEDAKPGGTSLKDLQLSEFKRPFLPGLSDFNISHSGKVVLCAFSDQGPVGVDVEGVTPIEVPDYASVLSPWERKSLDQLKEPAHVFFCIWTRKEAIIKAEGKGFYNELRSVTSSNNPVWMADRWWWFAPLGLPDQYVAHVASNQPIKKITLEYVPWETWLNAP